MANTIRVALWVRLEAKPGKEADVESFLRGGLSLVEQEPATTVWFGIRMGPTTFGIFDAFPNEAGRQAHLEGRVAAALMASASNLLAQAPTIEKVEILAPNSPARVSRKRPRRHQACWQLVEVDCFDVPHAGRAASGRNARA